MQSKFFDSQQTENTPSRAYQTPDQPVGNRLFLYDGQVFEDPGPEYSIQDVLDFLAQTYPELGNGTWTSRTLPDSTEEITFVKVTGEKGSGATSGNEVSLFDLPPDRPLLPGPVAEPPARRLFLYDGQVFEDPGPEYSVQDVLNFLAKTYPELGNGTWTTRTLPDDATGAVEEITFVKVTGEKGNGSGAPLNPRQLAACLDRLSPTQIRAVKLLDQITAIETDEALKWDVARLLTMAPDIETALQQAERISNESQRIVKQCLQLTPVPHPKVPLGF